MKHLKYYTALEILLLPSSLPHFQQLLDNLIIQESEIWVII